MLREMLKQELDRLNEDELKKIADFIHLISSQSNRVSLSDEVPFWQRATPTERALSAIGFLTCPKQVSVYLMMPLAEI